MQLKKTVAAVVLGFGFAAFAQAAPIYLGELSIDNPILDPYSANPNPLGQGNTQPFTDTYYFTVADDLLGVSGSMAYSSVASFNLSAVLFNISSLDVSIYKGDVIDPAFLVFGGSDNTGSFVTGSFNLDSSAYTLLISGVTTGAHGGGYTINMTGAAAAVPEPAEYAMLLAGLGVVGMIARRRKMKIN